MALQEDISFAVNEAKVGQTLRVKMCIRDRKRTCEIITLEWDNDLNARYRNPLALGVFIRQMVGDTTKDVDLLLGLKSLPNVDICVLA